jgi:hypothetical protein
MLGHSIILLEHPSLKNQKKNHKVLIQKNRVPLLLSHKL